MTEDISKTKWCPLAGPRLIATVFSVGASLPDGADKILEHESMCKASDCALWVVDRVRKLAECKYCGVEMESFGTESQCDRHPGAQQGRQRHEWEPKTKEGTEGRCGLRR